MGRRLNSITCLRLMCSGSLLLCTTDFFPSMTMPTMIQKHWRPGYNRQAQISKEKLQFHSVNLSTYSVNLYSERVQYFFSYAYSKTKYAPRLPAGNYNFHDMTWFRGPPWVKACRREGQKDCPGNTCYDRNNF